LVGRASWPAFFGLIVRTARKAGQASCPEASQNGLGQRMPAKLVVRSGIGRRRNTVGCWSSRGPVNRDGTAVQPDASRFVQQSMEPDWPSAGITMSQATSKPAPPNGSAFRRPLFQVARDRQIRRHHAVLPAIAPQAARLLSSSSMNWSTSPRPTFIGGEMRSTLPYIPPLPISSPFSRAASSAMSV
jgi:hypothetical protein